LFLGGLGTDTGGSVRLPSAWCGISGMKQTFGRVPKSGCVPLGFSYDHIGPMTRSARDCAAMLAVLAGHDDSDACSVDVPVDDYLAALTGTMDGLRVGVDTSFLDRDDCDPDVAALTRAAIEVFTDAGATITEVRLPIFEELCTSAMAGLKCEALAYHRADLQQRWADYGRSTRRSFAGSALMTGADYVQAQRVRRAGIRAVTEVFGSYDLLVTPTALAPAPLIEDLNTFLGHVPSLLLTPYWNATGNPAMSIPMGLTRSGLPVGLQLAGRPFEESTVFRAADAFQLRTTHHLTESPLLKEMLA
jgi:aspartyl-tRNA(Asn)/glutamyl-tRNA(Gln) amidotransferase subunit A